jgi:hypothetical protein
MAADRDGFIGAIFSISPPDRKGHLSSAFNHFPQKLKLGTRNSVCTNAKTSYPGGSIQTRQENADLRDT